MITASDNSWTKRWGILLLLSMVMFTGYVFMDLLSPLRELLEVQYGWDSTAYGLYLGSEMFLNLYFLFLLIGGLLLDVKGTQFMAIASGVFMVLGAVIEFFAFTDLFANSQLRVLVESVYINSDISSMPASAKLASLGMMLFGVGIESASLLVVKCIVKWFEGKELAMAMGIDMIVTRLGVFCAASLPGPSHRLFSDSIPGHMFLGVLFVCAGFSLLMVYRRYDKREEQKNTFYFQTERFTFEGARKTMRTKCFWISVLFCIAYYAIIFGGLSLIAQLLVRDLGYDGQFVNSVLSIMSLCPCIITPLICYFIDNRGKAISILVGGTSLTLLAFVISAFVLPANKSDLWLFVMITLLGTSFAIIPSALWPTVSKVVDRSALGLAYGIMYWLQNIGLILFPITTTMIYTNHGFVFTSLSYIAICVAAILLSVLLLLEDKNHRYELELPNIR